MTDMWELLEQMLSQLPSRDDVEASVGNAFQRFQRWFKPRQDTPALLSSPKSDQYRQQIEGRFPGADKFPEAASLMGQMATMLERLKSANSGDELESAKKGIAAVVDELQKLPQAAKDWIAGLSKQVTLGPPHPFKQPLPQRSRRKRQPVPPALNPPRPPKPQKPSGPSLLQRLRQSARQAWNRLSQSVSKYRGMATRFRRKPPARRPASRSGGWTASQYRQFMRVGGRGLQMAAGRLSALGGGRVVQPLASGLGRLGGLMESAGAMRSVPSSVAAGLALAASIPLATYALSKFTMAVRESSESLLDQQRDRFGMYSGRIAMSGATTDLHRMQMDMLTAKMTEDSTLALANEMKELRETMQPLEATFKNLQLELMSTLVTPAKWLTDAAQGLINEAQDWKAFIQGGGLWDPEQGRLVEAMVQNARILELQVRQQKQLAAQTAPMQFLKSIRDMNADQAIRPALEPLK